MPEGPEVRKHAEALDRALSGEPIAAFSARTKAAKAWLAAHPDALIGRRVLEVRSHGKNLMGRIEGGYFFYSHLMMWGRWEVWPNTEPVPIDRRERGRIVVPPAIALLYSAPVFEVGEGDLLALYPYLAALGPDSLPYGEDGPFDVEDFHKRLLAADNLERSIGAALLDQTIVAGLGNYLRAEILFACRVNPWKKVGELSAAELECLTAAIPEISALAYVDGATIPEEARERMRREEALVYQPGREYGTRYHVYRRTNLPCLYCSDTVRQLRQITHVDEEEEKTRIIYFCPTCQQVPYEPKRKPRKRAAPVLRPETEG